MEELHKVIREGHLHRVRDLVSGEGSLFDAADDKGKTAVSVAIENGNTEIVKWLIDIGCRLSKSARPKFGSSFRSSKNACFPSPPAVGEQAVLQTCNQDTQKFLNLNANGLVKHVNNFCNEGGGLEGHSVLENCTSTCSVNAHSNPEHSGRSALHDDTTDFFPPLLAAVGAGSYKMVKIVLESQRAQVDDMYKNVTPLLKACIEGYTDIVGLLLKHGADVNGRHIYDQSETEDSQWFHKPLYHAVQNNRSEIVEMLVIHGANYLHVVPLEVYSFHVADPSAISHRALATLLELAVRRCQPSVVALLIDSFRSEITDLGRYYALVWSVKFQQTGMTEVLIEKLYPDSYVMESDECRDKYRQVLRIAVRECPPEDETVPLLLLQRFGKSLFQQEEGFFIILHSAVLRSLPRLVIKLLEIAKDPSCMFDPSHYESWPDLCSAALYYGNKQILCALYDSGYLDLCTQSDSENAFFEAIFCGKNGSSVYEILSWLVDCGLDPNACDSNKMQPIHAAVTHRLNSAVDALCRLGVDANARMGTDDLSTPLHLQLNLRVLQLGCDLNLELIKVLIGHGADLAMENRKGYTPISILFWLLHANIRLQEVAAGRAIGALQGQGQNAANQPDTSHDPSPQPNPSGMSVDQASSVSLSTAASGVDARERNQSGLVSYAISVRGGEGSEMNPNSQAASNSQDSSSRDAHSSSVTPNTTVVSSHQGGNPPQALNQDGDAQRRSASASPSRASVSETVIMPTYLQTGSPWRTLIEILVDRFGVELFTMGAARLTGPDHWAKVYASLVHAEIDMGHLPTLRTMCWVLIRRCLGGVRFCEKVDQLPLPEVMKAYLKSI